MTHPMNTIHRMFELCEPIAISTFSEIANDAFLAVGMRNYWDGYFAGRAAALRDVPADVVHAVFYNFAGGEVARHIPWVWTKITPSQAIEVRAAGSAAALRACLGDLADSPALPAVADELTRVALSVPCHGRPLYAGLRQLPVPVDPVARLWHAATLLREHRGDGHNATLLAHGISGGEAHVLLAVGLGMSPGKFGRLHHLPAEHIAGLVGGLRERGLLDADARFTDSGRELKDRVEALTDALAAPAYDLLDEAELSSLIGALEPFAAAATQAE